MARSETLYSCTTSSPGNIIDLSKDQNQSLHSLVSFSLYSVCRVSGSQCSHSTCGCLPSVSTFVFLKAQFFPFGSLYKLGSGFFSMLVVHPTTQQLLDIFFCCLPVDRTDKGAPSRNTKSMENHRGRHGGVSLLQARPGLTPPAAPLILGQCSSNGGTCAPQGTLEGLQGLLRT